MALEMARPTEYGVPALYHRVKTMQVYYQERCCDVTLVGYASAETRATDSPILADTERLTFDALGLADDSDLTRAAIYDALKTLPKFADALDV